MLFCVRVRCFRTLDGDFKRMAVDNPDGKDDEKDSSLQKMLCEFSSPLSFSIMPVMIMTYRCLGYPFDHKNMPCMVLGVSGGVTISIDCTFAIQLYRDVAAVHCDYVLLACDSLPLTCDSLHFTYYS